MLREIDFQLKFLRMHLTAFAETSHLNTDLYEFESSQSEEKKVQSTDSSKACNKPRAFNCSAARKTVDCAFLSPARSASLTAWRGHAWRRSRPSAARRTVTVRTTTWSRHGRVDVVVVRVRAVLQLFAVERAVVGVCGKRWLYFLKINKLCTFLKINKFSKASQPRFCCAPQRDDLFATAPAL